MVDNINKMGPRLSKLSVVFAPGPPLTLKPSLNLCLILNFMQNFENFAKVKFRDILQTGTGHQDRRLNRDCPGQTGTYGRSMDNAWENATSGDDLQIDLVLLVLKIVFSLANTTNNEKFEPYLNNNSLSVRKMPKQKFPPARHLLAPLSMMLEWSARLARAFLVRRLQAPLSMMHILP